MTDSLTLAGLSTIDLTPMVSDLANRADANADGSISRDEFENFLSGLIKSIDHHAGSATSTTLTPRALASSQGAVASPSPSTAQNTQDANAPVGPDTPICNPAPASLGPDVPHCNTLMGVR